MSEIKQEWVAAMEEALRHPARGARDLVAAVAPLIRADALREAAAQASRKKVLVTSAEAMAGKCEEMIELEMNIATMAADLISGLISDDILALIDAPKKP